MLDASFRTIHLPGSFAEAGFRYGRACAHLLEPARLEWYLSTLAAINRVGRATLSAAAPAWARRLPAHYVEQMQAMADGAGVGFETLAEFLYADIAAQGRVGVHAHVERSGAGGAPAAVGGAEGAGGMGGPMCSGVLLHHGQESWVARNCDWYQATLSRGTAAVFHAPPGRIPSLYLGILGDLDCDTGLNAERLWLHMHTLLALDEPRAGTSCISWLFWMREALETCSTLDDVERFIAGTDRDRGVILLACDGKADRGRGEMAVFECTRSSYRRVGPDHPDAAYGRGRFITATNHTQAKHNELTADGRRPREVSLQRAASTVSRCERLRELLTHAHPEHLPDDLMEVLGDPLVEMRTPETMRTIYSAVVRPTPGGAHDRHPAVWFASGQYPAASQGTWRKVECGW